MLYWLLYQRLYFHFAPHLSSFRIFRYVTFRTAFASLTALFMALIIGPAIIRMLREFQIGQYIREEGPQAHQKKAGTPTMGGVLINIAIVIPTLLWADLSNPFIWLVIFATVAFGAIGFTDDYLKVINKRNLGLTGKTKLVLQFAVSLAIGAVLMMLNVHKQYSTQLIVPFFKQFRPDLVIDAMRHNPHLWPLAFAPFLIVVMLVIVFSSNA
ncbi:MAG TPA: phospho-N-acetylmuramoyl-pentapeptide-transferase, partial [Alphaproteobacteria bacterium]|nr:phospho-N-acetylmuramoyl-pentapeptide-transferase [Alphaproteobacteria bacterium]